MDNLKKDNNEIIIKIMKDILKRDDNLINWNSQFLYSDLCIDSFEAISIIVEIENTFNIEMPDNCLAIEFLNSIEDISKKITEVIEKKTIV